MPARFMAGYLTLAYLAVNPGTVVAQENQGNDAPTTLTAEECALVENGVQRLACYDALYGPDEAQNQAAQAEIERVEMQTKETLPPREEQLEELTDSEDGDAGVMDGIVDQYIAAEKAIFSFSGSFVGHRPTYILPISWVKDPNPIPTSPRLGSTGYDYDLRHEEAKYQISFKVPLLTGLLDDRTTLWFGYTQQSFWQVYNRDDSAPFRETNYQPELFLRYQTDWKIGPGKLSAVHVGFNHQSNGQSEPRSRSWNRIVGSAAYSYDRWLFVVEPWYRIPENNNDDNADIERYLGHANYLAVYKLSEDRTFSLRLMNNLRSDNRTTVEFGYSFPMGDTVKGFFQYYNGYGESLIDYNHRIERFGIGIMLNDWL
ncbi:Phospholipase A1 precursor [Marinobacter nitratireducens]|uniref:Phospholipase A1 n=1 Tax=Marinobacter nitratireducens TaxID=1137280 RepID=A0A072MY77_9GAMM|nr:phospholipase A [Marinobacter nitratireducens]KEF30201.1 Phospholipase A1 precursor [Marinobacter nitratireducens]